MQYIDVEKLIAMLRERYNTYKIGQHSPFRSGKVETLRETIELIDSLQQEQPEADFEKEVEKFCLEYDARKEVWFDMTSRDQKMLSTPTWGNFAENIARHFYELGLNARKEK